METAPNTDTACPYCGHHFPDPPKRRRKCKACGETVIVKAEPETWKQRLMTVDEATATELRWERFEHRRALLQAVGPFGITEEALAAIERNIERWRQPPVPIIEVTDYAFKAVQSTYWNEQSFWLSWSMMLLRLGLNPTREQREHFRCAATELAKVPSVAGVMVQCTDVGRRDGCIVQRHFVPNGIARENPPLPCRMSRHCFGYLTAVFDDEVATAPKSWRSHQRPMLKPREHPMTIKLRAEVARPKPWWKRLLGL